MADLRISAFSSLDFDHDWKRDFQRQVCYIQKVQTDDVLRVQYSTSPDASGIIVTQLRNLETDKITVISSRQVSVAQDGYKVYDAIVFHPQEGCYAFELLYDGLLMARAFFQSVQRLDNSLLFSYTNCRDEFETVFSGRFFFRVEGTLLPQETIQVAENEQFRDQYYGLHTISGYAYDKRTITIGGPMGVPQWVGGKINRILSCTDVTLDGQEIVRSEDSAPSITVLDNMYPLYRFKVEIECGNSAGGASIDLDGYDALYIVSDNAGYPLATSDGEQLHIKKE